jgi:hypothetical protein
MKNNRLKKICIVVLLVCAVSLGADSPRRVFEFGFDADSELANNYFSIRDFPRKTLVMDLSELSEKLSRGFQFYSGLKGGIFFNLEIPDKFGAGIFSRADVMVHTSLPQSLLDLAAEGRELGKTYHSDFGTGGAAFAETGFRGSFSIPKLGGLKVSLQPAYYMPILYMTKPSIEYFLASASGGLLNVEGNYAMSIYSAFSLEEADGLTGRGGIDLGLALEYPLLSNLTLGASFSHIPLLPAELRDRMLLEGNFSFKANDVLGQMKDDEFAPITNSKQMYDTSSVTVRRPFKFGLNAVYQPFNDYPLSFIPFVGFTVNGIYDVPVYVDAGLTAELNLRDMLILDLGCHYEDLIWKQRFDIILNFRAFELELGVSLESQNFLKSFQAKGMGASLGMRFGW